MKNLFKNQLKGKSILGPKSIKEILSVNPICKPINDVDAREIHSKTEPLYWLNPHNQHCFNYGWFTRQDYIDWVNNTGNIIKGDTPEEKQKFLDVARFEQMYHFGWAIGYHKKHFDLIDDSYKPKYGALGLSSNCKDPLKITKSNHGEIISKIMGKICAYYSDSEYEMEINSNRYRMMNSEISGAKQTLFCLGVGYYAAINSPEDVENLSFIGDIVKYKVFYNYCINNNIEIPDFDFVYNYNKTNKLT
jgi:hypothetical protein